jgi:hypothetical protein
MASQFVNKSIGSSGRCAPFGHRAPSTPGVNVASKAAARAGGFAFRMLPPLALDRRRYLPSSHNQSDELLKHFDARTTPRPAIALTV